MDTQLHSWLLPDNTTIEPDQPPETHKTVDTVVVSGRGVLLSSGPDITIALFRTMFKEWLFRKQNVEEVIITFT